MSNWRWSLGDRRTLRDDGDGSRASEESSGEAWRSAWDEMFGSQRRIKGSRRRNERGGATGDVSHADVHPLYRKWASEASEESRLQAAAFLGY